MNSQQFLPSLPELIMQQQQPTQNQQYQKANNKNNQKQQKNKDDIQDLKNSKPLSYSKITNINIDHIIHSEKIKIKDFDVFFPFKPYELQKNYMGEVIQTLNNPDQNALLSSPTGTGKTLCLLCSSLSWLSQNRALQIKEENLNEPIKIIYASRTHSQLKQVVEQLEKTVYRPKLVILASRDQYCINTKVNKYTGTNLNSSCKEARLKGGCHYFNGCQKEQQLEKIAKKLPAVLDIDGLNDYGRQGQFCPYYVTQDFSKTADLILMPYNYLLNYQFLKSLKINLENSIVIFDEAHNVDKVTEDGYSPKITSYQIENGITFLQDLPEVLNNDKLELKTPIDMTKLPALISVMEKFLDYLKLNKPQYDDQIISHDSKKIFSIIQNNTIGLDYPKGLDLDSIRLYLLSLEHIIEVLDMIDTSSIQTWSIFLIQIQVFYYFFNLQSLWIKHVELKEKKFFFTDNDINNFMIFISKEKSFEKYNIVLELCCFTPSIGFKNLKQKGVRNIILTSGTLEPMASLESTIKLNFNTKLLNPHIIDSKAQVFATVIRQGNLGTTPLNFTYDSLQNSSQQIFDSLGRILIDMALIVKNGILVFFSSYKQLDDVYKYWFNSRTRILDELSAIKTEPTSGLQLKTKLQQFKNAAIGDGAIFLGVLRGKISEGLDFADEYTRAVFIVGIPFPPLKDLKIKAKRDVTVLFQYLDYVYKITNNKEQVLKGQDWYFQQAIRAINQALGRTIRHKDDWGGIFLCDERYQNNQNQKQLSEWVQKALVRYDSYQDIKTSAQFFFQSYYSQNELQNQQELQQSNIQQNLQNILNDQTYYNEQQNQQLINKYKTQKKQKPVQLELEI